MDLDEENDIEDFEEKTTTSIAKAFDLQLTTAETLKKAANRVEALLVQLETLMHTFSVRALRPMVYIVTGMVIIMGLQQLSLINRDEKVDQVNENVGTVNDNVTTLDQDVKTMKIAADEAKKASEEAKIASEAAKKSLDEAIAQSQRGGQSPETIEAFRRLNELYAVCVEQKECFK